MSSGNIVPAGAIDEPYLLILNIPLIRHQQAYWADPLWAKDLLHHLDYIRRLTLFCPVQESPPPDGWTRIDHPRLDVIRSGPAGRAMLLHLPLTAWRLWRAIRKHAVVHTGVAGWPLPLGWLAAPLARLNRRFLLIIVESSFWRAPAGAPLTKRLRGWLSERINRAWVNRCDLAIFTTDQYRVSLATRPRGATAVIPASWVSEDQLLTAEGAEQAWRHKTGRLLYAGRLTDGKGVRTLLAALENSPLAVDIVGDGELLAECRALAARAPERVRLLATVEHGDAFSRLLDRYDAVIVPTLTDEQPRILFDAFARGIPAIASSTAANREIVGDGTRGLLFARGDPAALAAAMGEALRDRRALQQQGMLALRYAAERTHAAMHSERAALLARVLGRSDPAGATASLDHAANRRPA